mgnify:CR=1 FL=1
MDPRVIFGIAGGVLAFSLPLFWWTGLPKLWAPTLMIGAPFAYAAWWNLRKYYPGRPGYWCAGTILTILPTLVALWVVQQAGTMAGQLAVKRQESDLRTEVGAMLRDKPEDYPSLGEGLRQERLGRLAEIRRNPNLSPRTAEFVDKATDYLENKLPQERGFRYRIGTESRLRDAVTVLEKATPAKPAAPLPFPSEGYMVVVEDRAGLKPPTGERYALADLYAMRGVALRAACSLDEAEWLGLITWSQPVLVTDRHAYPCTLQLFSKKDGKWLPMASMEVPRFAIEAEADPEYSTAAPRGYNLGERPRQEAIRRWLQGGEPGKAD